MLNAVVVSNVILHMAICYLENIVHTDLYSECCGVYSGQAENCKRTGIETTEESNALVVESSLERNALESTL